MIAYTNDEIMKITNVIIHERTNSETEHHVFNVSAITHQKNFRTNKTDDMIQETQNIQMKYGIWSELFFEMRRE